MTVDPDRAAQQLGLILSSESRAEVVKNLALLAGMAAVVEAAQPAAEPQEFSL
jgi:hypothetical protein